MTKTPDVAIVGSSAAGIAAGVRAAREGLETTCVTSKEHNGGLVSSGVSNLDTHYGRQRSPILQEFIDHVRSHYASTYGEESTQFERCKKDGKPGYAYEPSVAESFFDEVSDHENFDIRRTYHPESVDRSGAHINSVSFRHTDSGEELVVDADTFVDATYEGDLAARAGVPYRLGRESRDAFDEPHAGKIFTRIEHDSPGHPHEAVNGTLDVDPFPLISKETLSGSTGEGDDAIQTYNSRPCLSCDPDNRRIPEKPDGYDRETYAHILKDESELQGDGAPLKSRVYLEDPTEWEDGIPHAYPRPNDKREWNSANLVGGSDDWPEADPEERAAIEQRHLDHMLGLLYFLQNDPEVPEEVRERAREWGLAKDEFEDNDNLPYEIYVREARRIDGRAAFTEHDARVAPGLERAPVHHDSIAITDWVMDCHDVTTERRIGSAHDGDIFLTELTRPGQVPYGTLLPEGLDNLLVPVAVSASHVGFQTIRLEPAWMQIGEAVGLAASLARQSDTTVAELDLTRLQHALLDRGSMVSFFNDCHLDLTDDWVEPIQFFGTKGFFGSYDARPEEPLRRETAAHWVDSLGQLIAGSLDPMTAARALPDPDNSSAVTRDEFDELLHSKLDVIDPATLESGDIGTDETVRRGEACRRLNDLYRST